mmetsp:Transcript_30806/g.56361  ORF Transcript_30806/g.56361 Transcript_30806/m.56361 type:complete len:228 (-) Transcript_30806:93-776(-)
MPLPEAPHAKRPGVASRRITLCAAFLITLQLTAWREADPLLFSSIPRCPSQALLSQQLRHTRNPAAWRTVRRAQQPALDFDIDVVVGKKIKPDTETSKDSWVVLVHAPIRACKMPLCKVPGLRNIICTCLRDGVEPGKGIRSKDGKCALTVDQYAEVLSEGIPLLSRRKAYGVAQKLFESAVANPVGTAVVIQCFKRAADDYHSKLTALGLWTSVAPLDGGGSSSSS